MRLPTIRENNFRNEMAISFENNSLDIRLSKDSATMEFFDSDRPRSWIPHELLIFMKKIAQNIAKNVAILILLNHAQCCELRG